MIRNIGLVLAMHLERVGVGAKNAATQIIHGGAVPNDAIQVAAHAIPGKPPVNTSGVQQATQQVLPATGPPKVF
ncbi:unnamed protein product [Adineta steineri]|uniref:Uncharacterized protein n=1 Tax=Adineta steineri TaxID=433720 RepID=A0A819R759_9BILA|nr:unnamed protein product [Adineta steineri]CAF1049001.1 unnamed protein product [Adineta steineri]CAF4043201.1 unnamed protein product [Adineta steineri]CAF4100403.1 unnamed protein product [Adineta steineri]